MSLTPVLRLALPKIALGVRTARSTTPPVQSRTGAALVLPRQRLTFARGFNVWEQPTKLDWMADSVTPQNSL
jgi:hypothetical protein